MRILVTGGAGFIGSHFVRHMLENHPIYEDHRITVLDSMTYAANPANLADVQDRIDFIHGDIRDRDMVDFVMSETDAVVHFAAESHVDRSLQDTEPFVQTNVLGTQVLVDAAVRHDIHKFVHVSTDEVYGSITQGSWTEEYPLQPRSPYAASKAASEMVVMAAHHTYKLNTVVTRGSNTYGPNQYHEKLIPLFATNLLRGKKVPLYGDGLNVRDWLHVKDHVRAIDMVLHHGKRGQVYNIAGNQERSNIQVTDIILRTLGMGWDRVEFVADRQGHDRRYSMLAAKMERAFQFRPVYSDVVKGIPETVRWYRDNRTWWDPSYVEETTA